MIPDLDPKLLGQIRTILAHCRAVEHASIFGSRAKGTASATSDIDIAVFGDLTHLDSQHIASELEDLPQPLRFDVIAYDRIRMPELREHIDRVGIEIYRRQTSGVHASRPKTARA